MGGVWVRRGPALAGTLSLAGGLIVEVLVTPVVECLGVQLAKSTLYNSSTLGSAVEVKPGRKKCFDMV